MVRLERRSAQHPHQVAPQTTPLPLSCALRTVHLASAPTCHSPDGRQGRDERPAEHHADSLCLDEARQHAHERRELSRSAGDRVDDDPEEIQ